MSGWAGDEFLYFVALAILDEHRDSLKYLMTFDEVLKVLHHSLGSFQFALKNNISIFSM
jgi:hypothetical protein